MPTVDELAHEIAHRTGGHQHKQQNGWMVRCPAHDDREASLSIREGRTQPLVHCFAGCSQEKVIGALQQMGVWPERGEYRRPDPSAVVQRKREETTKQIQARAWEQLLDRHPDLPAEARHFVDLKPLQHAAAVPSEKTTDLERINAKLRQGPNLEPLRQPLPLTPEFRTADRLDRAHRADRAARELRPEFGEQLRALRDTARLPTNSSEASHVDRLRRRSDTLTVEGIARELSPAYAAASFAVSKSRNVLQQAMSDLRRAYAVKERAELQIRERTEEMGPMRRAMHVRWTPHMTLPQKALYRVARDTQLNEYERYRGGAIKKIRALTPEVRGAQATVKTWETTAIREFEAIQPAAEAELHRRQAAEAEEARFGFKNTPELKKGRSLSL
jgi:hypothetical protein